jgi:hypothetical protein
MVFKRIMILGFLLGLVMFAGASAQDDEPVVMFHPVSFHLLYDPLDLAFETWDDTEAPDTVKLDAFRIASGYLLGFPFHYERSRDIVTVYEQLEVVTDELQYLGYSEENSYYRFDFVCLVPTDHWTEARSGQAYQGHGESGNEDDPEAIKEAKDNALEEAIRAYIKSQYTDRELPIPGVVDGRIRWFDVNNEMRDSESGSYIMDITAWIESEEE